MHFSTVLQCFARVRLRNANREIYLPTVDRFRVNVVYFRCTRWVLTISKLNRKESMVVLCTVLSFSRRCAVHISSSRSSQTTDQYFPHLQPSWTAVSCSRKTFTSLLLPLRTSRIQVFVSVRQVGLNYYVNQLLWLFFVFCLFFITLVCTSRSARY